MNNKTNAEEEYLELTPESLEKLTTGNISQPKESKFENEFYLYEDITQESMGDLLTFIKERVRDWNSFLLKNNDIVDNATPKPIIIYINSQGGDLHAVLPVIDYLNHYKTKLPIHTVVEGVAASAASLLAVSGHHRVCTKNSYLLIHELRTQMRGTYSNFIDETENCEKLMDSIKNIYINSSNNKLEENRLEALLKRDLLLSSDECLELGLIDEIIG